MRFSKTTPAIRGKASRQPTRTPTPAPNGAAAAVAGRAARAATPTPRRSLRPAPDERPAIGGPFAFPG